MSKSSSALKIEKFEAQKTALPDPQAQAISTRFIDFWLLGGASIVVLLVMSIGSYFRGTNLLIQQKFVMIAPVFGLFSIFCNDPHFMVSYKFGYSRGMSFVGKYWISLVAVPIALILIYAAAYFNFDAQLSETLPGRLLNHACEWGGLDFRISDSMPLGQALLGFSILLMYLTVGWHYSKQVYGCMMVYDRFDDYQLRAFEKTIIKYSLLSLALYQFLYSSRLIDQAAAAGYHDNRFGNAYAQPLDLPDWLTQAAGVVAVLSFVSVVLIFVRKFVREKKTPSLVFLVAWLSLYFWWIQFLNMPEYYFMMVPFFHSLQYLPFAAKMENKSIPRNKWRHLQITLRISLLVLVGFLAFELLPSLLDAEFDTELTKTAWFFGTAIVVFINVHHFFIDSVVWRLDQRQVKSGLLGKA